MLLVTGCGCDDALRSLTEVLGCATVVEPLFIAATYSYMPNSLSKQRNSIALGKLHTENPTRI